MSEKNGGLFDSFISGGQITLHKWRMTAQVVRYVLYGALGSWVLLAAYTFMEETSAGERYELWKLNEAHLRLWIHLDKKPMEFTNPDGSVGHIYPQDYVSNPIVLHTLEKSKRAAIHGLLGATGWVFFCVGAIIVIFVGIGRMLKRTQFNRGARIVPAGVLRKMIKKANRKARRGPRYEVAGLPYPADSEQQHTIIVGSTGSGKTVLIRGLLNQIRARGDRAIIYDRTGSYTGEYFDQAKDTLLSPFDARGVDYTIFSEIRERPHLDAMMAALIPEPSGGADPFWNAAARIMAAEAAWQLYCREGGGDGRNVSTTMLTDLLYRTTLKELAHYLKGTPGASIVDPESPKTVISIRAVLSAYLKPLQYLHEGESSFSIREWIGNPEQSGFLFIGSRAEHHEAIKPLITLWMDVAVSALLSLQQSRNRRVWIILDELASLQRLPSLSAGMAEARQYGGCFVLGLQNVAQLINTYGKQGADSISALAQTRLLLKQPDHNMAEWAAKNFGDAETVSVQNSMSFGANEIRDGVSLSNREQRKALVLPSEITGLKSLETFVIFPEGYPAAKVSFPYQKNKPTAEQFIPRADTPLVGSASGTLPAPFEFGDIEDEQEEQEQAAAPVEMESASPPAKPTRTPATPIFEDDAGDGGSGEDVLKPIRLPKSKPTAKPKPKASPKSESAEAGETKPAGGQDYRVARQEPQPEPEKPREKAQEATPRPAAPDFDLFE